MEPLRLSDADREAAVAQLGEQYAFGRITKDEFDERSDAVWSARTRGDLAPVFVDLPVGAPAQPARPSARPPHRRSGRAFPLLPALFVLIALTALTRMPFVLLAIGLWFVLGRWSGSGCRSLR